MIELGADLAAAEAPMDIAECAAARLRSAVQCTDCDIWWLEEGYLRCLASVDGGGVDESVRGRLLQLDHYPSTRRALEEREILVISSLDDERLTDEEREDFGEFDFHSLVSIPLVSNDAVVGLIDVFDVRERDYDDVRSFLASAGRTVADALRNAELLAELRRGNAAQRELVELGDRLNEADTLEGFSRAVAERLRTDPLGRGLRYLAGRRRRAALPRQRGQPWVGRGGGRVGARPRRVRGDGQGPGRERADRRGRSREQRARRERG